MSKKAIITIGCSGSGKSTWAKQFAQEQLRMGVKWFIIERDEERKRLKTKSNPNVNFWSEWNWKLEGQVTEACAGYLNVANSASGNVIISDTNLNAHFRKILHETLVAQGFDVEYKHFNLPYKKLLERDNMRADSVGQQVIAKQYFEYMEQYGEMYGLKKIVQDSSLPDCILVDIDGTLAHMDGKRGPFEWDKVGLDSVDETMRDIVRMYDTAKIDRIIIMSGRDSICRAETHEWLWKHEIPFDYLYMRAENDMRADFEVKNEIIQEHVNGKYNVKAWFDDRPQIIRLGNILGAKIFAVGNQTIEF